MENSKNKVIIIDFGSQFTQLLARKIREHKVLAEVYHSNITLEQIIQLEPSAIILSGGPSSVYEKNAPTLDVKLFDLNIPMLGICYGQQLMCHLLEGKVEPGVSREYGRANLTIVEKVPLFAGIPQDNFNVWMSHGDSTTKLPKHFKILASTTDTESAVIGNVEKKLYGIQFHPEVFHSEYGSELISNFLFKIADCKANWDIANVLEEQIAYIQDEVKDNKVICGVSGGVDSTVVAAILAKAIGKNFHPIFIDTGLLRLNEAEYAKEIFAKHLNIDLEVIDASNLFLSRLKDVRDPETKRKIIGHSFIEVFEEAAKKIKDAKYLAQGTLYSDVIESSASSENSVVIKSHHNVGGLPENMNFKLIEPVNKLFKDEVRELGIKLGLPYDVVYRHPFPGPGLAIRILGDINLENLETLKACDDIYIKELKESGLYNKIWQAFSILTPIQTVGVMGDGRTYEKVLALRAVTSTDGMTADFYPMPYDFLARVSNKIINNVQGVSRVVYDVTSKPPATIEWE